MSKVDKMDDYKKENIFRAVYILMEVRITLYIGIQDTRHIHRPTKLWDNPTNKQLYANIVSTVSYNGAQHVGGLVPLNNTNLGNQFGNQNGSGKSSNFYVRVMIGVARRKVTENEWRILRRDTNYYYTLNIYDVNNINATPIMSFKLKFRYGRWFNS